MPATPRGNRAVSHETTETVAEGFAPEPWRQATVPPEPPAGDLAFTCPRCGQTAQAATYGPCASCRADLRTRLGGEAHTIEHEDYVPKMNVTPNAVALKD